MTSKNLQGKNIEEQLTFFPAASHASHLVLPGSEKAKKMTVTSGKKWSKLLEISNPLGLLAKMLLESSAWESSKCYLTWKTKAINARHFLYQLAPKTPRTDETEFGSSDIYQHPILPTPRANEIETECSAFHGVNRIAKDGREWGANIATIVKMLPTPNTIDAKDRKYQMSKGKKILCLPGQIAMLPTPTTSGFDHLQDRGKGNLHEIAGSVTGLKLQPNFVEWMMGYPQNWTDLNSPRANTETKG